VEKYAKCTNVAAPFLRGLTWGWDRRSVDVLLAEPDPDPRAGLRVLLETVVDTNVVAGAETWLEVLELIRRVHPNVVVIDRAPSRPNATETTQQTLRSEAVDGR
jgi:DNA-binding NarL/FixJ family response regulator